MVRARTEYHCRDCGYRAPGALGRCPGCDAWGSFDAVVERAASPRSASGRSLGDALTAQASRALSLHEIDLAGFDRLEVSLGEFARVLGGGIVRGSLVLVGGDPGVGKSTLLTQVADLVAQSSGTSLYVSGEESLAQVALRARRMGLSAPGFRVASETDLDAIVATIQEAMPAVAVVDSIQSVVSADVDSLPGSVTQLRECTLRFMHLAKVTGVAVMLIGHVTKEGTIAGPKVLEHMVDAVLYLEGERFNAYRLLRSTKNRFGPTHEIGVFEMHQEGLVEVSNPSALFLAERGEAAPGCVVTVTLEGSRPILVEVQALASKTTLAVPRRSANGFDSNRLHLIGAVLARRLGLPLWEQDVYLNIVGGLRVDEPAADLAAALCIVSSYRDRPIPADYVAFGELGLSGELRSVGQTERRVREAAKLGFKRALVAKSPGQRLPPARELGLEVLTVSTLREAVRVLGL